MADATTDGTVYIPMEERTSDKVATIYFTRDLSPKGMEKVYERVNGKIGQDKVAIKLHTGEPHGPNIIPPAWIKQFREDEVPNADIIETNTFYAGDRYTTEQHRKTLAINGWDFCPGVITDEFGTA